MDRPSLRGLAAALLLATLALSSAACAASPTAAPAPDTSNPTTVSTTPSQQPALPPAGALFDYQLGGAYPPPPGVEIVARDRTAAPADGMYNICYINAFQTQPGELDTWPSDLLLRDADGDPFHDPDWPDEVIVDTRQPDAVAAIVGPWIDGCAAAGYNAVEFDNLDTYTRTGDLLSRDDNLALARLLVARAHDDGLAAGQKNAAEDAALLHEQAGFDFAITEECVAYDECGAYTDVYGEHVLAIEYPDTLTDPWSEVCARADLPASLILRDRDLVTPDRKDYVFETCR